MLSLHHYVIRPFPIFIFILIYYKYWLFASRGRITVFDDFEVQSYL